MVQKVFTITKSEIKPAAITLKKAFANDPMMKWLFVTEEDYEKKAEESFGMWVNYCIIYGVALRTENFESIALRKKPGDIKFSFWRALRSGMLKTPKVMGKESFERLKILDDVITKEKLKNMGHQTFWYCWTLGTDPQLQNQGFGTLLMNHTFNMAKADGLPCYLETIAEHSKAVHLHKGYKILSEVLLPKSNITIISMLNQFEGKSNVN